MAADGGIHDLYINTLLFHVFEPARCTETASPGPFKPLHSARRGVEKFLGVHGIVAILLCQGLTFNHHALAAVSQFLGRGRAISELGINVIPPDLGWFHLMAICVEDAVTVTHVFAPDVLSDKENLNYREASS